MDNITFLDLIKKILNAQQSPDIEAENKLNAYREQNLVGFLESCLNIILNNTEYREKQRAAAYIYSSYTRVNFSEAPFDISPFMNKLFEALPTILSAYPLGDTVSNLIIPTITKLIISNFQATGNIDLQQYILNLYSQNQNLEPYILTIIFEVVLGDSDLGGFSIDLLLQIVVGELHFAESIIPRCQLYFAIASHALESPVLHELFDTLLSSIPNELIHRALYVLDTFIEKTPVFLAQHLDFLYPSLIALMQNAPDDARWLAMSCLASLVENYPDIFQHSQELYQSAFNILIKSIAEVQDTIPEGEESEEESTICINAKDALKRICAVAGCTEFFDYLENMRVSVFQDKQNLTWQIVYSFISIIKLLDPLTLTALTAKKDNEIDEDFSKINDFVQMLFSLVLDPETHPKIRIAVYDGISKLCKTALNYFQRATGDYVPETLKQLVFNDPYPNCQKRALKALTRFFNGKVLHNTIIEFFPRSFDDLLQLIPQFSEEFIIYIIRALSSFTKVLDLKKPEHSQRTTVLLNALIKQYTVSKESSLKMEIIFCFELTIQKIFSQIPRADFLKYCMFFMKESILMYQSGDLTPQEISPSICGLILILKKNVNLLIPDFLPFLIQESSKDLEIEVDNSLNIRGYSSNLYQRVQSQVYGAKIYILKQSIKNIESSITILISLVSAMGSEFDKHIPECMQVIQKWFMNEIHIERLKKICWDFLLSIFSSLHKREETISDEMFDFAYTIISQSSTIDCGAPLYTIKIYLTLNSITEIAYKSGYYNEELFIQFLNVSTMLIDHNLNLKQEKLNTLSQFTKEDVIEEENREIAHLDQTLDRISVLIIGFFRQYKQLAIPWFKNNLFEKCQQYITMPHAYTVGCQLLTFYTLTTEEIELVYSLADIFMEIIRNCTIQTEYKQFYATSYTIMEFLGQLVSSFELSPDFSQKILEFFIKFVGDEGLADNNDLSFIHDVGLVAFTKFLIKNMHNLDSEVAIDEWFACFPLWDNVCGSKIVYSFLADLIEERNPVFFSDEEMLKSVIERVILHIDKEAMKIQTINRLLNFIQEMYNDPNTTQLIETVLEGIEENRKYSFLFMMNNPPEEEESD